MKWICPYWLAVLAAIVIGNKFDMKIERYSVLLLLVPIAIMVCRHALFGRMHEEDSPH